MVPTINSAVDVQRVVSAAYYPSEERPTGSRSISWPIRWEAAAWLHRPRLLHG